MHLSALTTIFIVMFAKLTVVRSFAVASGGGNLWKLSSKSANKLSTMHMSYTADQKAGLVERLIDAKAASKLTFDQIATTLGLTNAQTAQLFTNQAQLSPRAAALLKVAVPGISEEDLVAMQKVPMRSFDPEMMQVKRGTLYCLCTDLIRDQHQPSWTPFMEWFAEPFVYRLVEAMQHYGLGLKMLANEKKGDGIISAIDLYVSMDMIKGKADEDRFVITLNGKFLPHVEQLTANNTAALGQKK